MSIHRQEHAWLVETRKKYQTHIENGYEIQIYDLQKLRSRTELTIKKGGKKI